MGDALGNEIAILNEQALRGIPGEDIALGPTAEGTPAPPPAPPGRGISTVGRQAAFLDEATMQWRLDHFRNHAGIATFRENTMAFSVLRLEKDYALLQGPGGSAELAHQWNDKGFDGAAIKLHGPFELLIPDDKPPGRIQQATAQTVNLKRSLERLAVHLQHPWFDDVPRIREARIAIEVAHDRVRNDLPLPADVKLATTQHGELTRTVASGPPATESELAAAAAKLEGGGKGPRQRLPVRTAVSPPAALSTPAAVESMAADVRMARAGKALSAGLKVLGVVGSTLDALAVIDMAAGGLTGPGFVLRGEKANAAAVSRQAEDALKAYPAFSREIALYFGPGGGIWQDVKNPATATVLEQRGLELIAAQQSVNEQRSRALSAEKDARKRIKYAEFLIDSTAYAVSGAVTGQGEMPQITAFGAHEDLIPISNNYGTAAKTLARLDSLMQADVDTIRSWQHAAATGNKPPAH